MNLTSLFGRKNKPLADIDFVILASQRTGSNMLVSLLDAYPQVRCHGELFRVKGKPRAGALEILNDLPDEFEDPEYRAEAFLEYLQRVRKLSAAELSFGFKLMLNQAPEARHALIQKSRCKIVLLYRENLLAVHSSNLIAKATGQGNVPRDQNVKSSRVEFVESKFDWFLKQQETRYEDARRELAQYAHGRYMEISYLELCHPQGKTQVEDFLAVLKPEAPLAPTTAKRNSNRIVDRFSNPEVVTEYLERTGRLAWLEESLE